MNEFDNVDLSYIPGQRYVVVIKDIETGRSFFSKRMVCEATAIDMQWKYNAYKTLKAKILDTKSSRFL